MMVATADVEADIKLTGPAARPNRLQELTA